MNAQQANIATANIAFAQAMTQAMKLPHAAMLVAVAQANAAFFAATGRQYICPLN